MTLPQEYLGTWRGGQGANAVLRFCLKVMSHTRRR
jgi:hypothetical protein